MQFHPRANPIKRKLATIEKGADVTADHAPKEHGNEAHNPDFATSSELSTHAGNASAHHTRYTDAEAIAVAGNAEIYDSENKEIIFKI